jgi:NAD+-dependent protein deacetylase sirtuin 4
MRISVPNITVSTTRVSQPLPAVSASEAIERLVAFLEPSRSNVNASNGVGAAVLTGAGCSRDSGVRTYRGEDGRYVNPNYKLSG